MPHAPMHGCTRAGCPELVKRGQGRCDKHAAALDQSLDRDRASSAERGYGANWQRLRKLVLHRDPVCCICKTAPSRDVDHIQALRAGGTNDLTNLQGLCGACHSRKTATEDGRWGRRG